MRKILPVIVFIIGFFFTSVYLQPVFAQVNTVNGTPTVATQAPEGSWVEDQEVTFVGKTAVRAQDFLSWALENYDWACVKQTATSCDNSNNPLLDFWKFIRSIVYVFLILFVLAAAFIIVITRGKNLTIMRFMPRFFFVVIFVTLSFSLIQFIYVTTDIIQGCFLRLDCRNPQIQNNIINKDNLLHVAFAYPTFVGYREIGSAYEESAFISLLLVRLTAYTYYAMTLILIVRKIILWFFIIISAVFPLLLFYNPLRNTAKIWIGEFFRWLLYAPLFAIFLHGLVVMWQKTDVQNKINGIPLAFSFTGAIQYPTAINILLGGPGQSVSITNSVNLPDTFAQYVVALLMLWVVILLPFLLLNIFLDYLKSISFKDSTVMKQLVSHGKSFIGRSDPVPATPPPSPRGTGFARALPLGEGAVRTIDIQSAVKFTDAQAANEMMRLTNLAIPKMRDIAKYESSLLSRDVGKKQEINHVSSTLQKIANPSASSTPAERERFSTVRNKLMSQKQKGDPVANQILSASSVVAGASSNTSPAIASLQQQKERLVAHLNTASNVQEKDRLKIQIEAIDKQINSETDKAFSSAGTIKKDRERLVAELAVSKDKAEKDRIAQQISEIDNAVKNEAAKAAQVSPAVLPIINRVQQVSLEDYEEVRKMWEENYKSLEPPKSIEGGELSRRQWVKGDIEKINQAVNLLGSIDPQKNKEGMDMVANILPFLLIGGFSRSEVIAYLKAKLEAAKSTIAEIEKREEAEDELVETQKKTAQTEKSMTAEENIDTKTPKEMPSVSGNPVFKNNEEK